MRAIVVLFIFSVAITQVIHASPLPTLTRCNDNNNLSQHTSPCPCYNLTFETRWHKSSKKPPIQKAPTITFKKGKNTEGHLHFALDALDSLGLQGKKRKLVEDYHRKLVADHMKKIPDAHTAEIIHLAHKRGSRDTNIHITAEIKGKNGKLIWAPRRGNPQISDAKHHIYVDTGNLSAGYQKLPKVYTKVLDKQARREGRKTGVDAI